LVEGALGLPEGTLSRSVAVGTSRSWELAAVLPVTVVVAAIIVVASNLSTKTERCLTTGIALREFGADLWNASAGSSGAVNNNVRIRSSDTGVVGGPINGEGLNGDSG